MFLSSHQLPDVELVCSRVSIIHHGKLLAVGKISELTAGDKVEIRASGVTNGVVEQIRGIAGPVEQRDGQIRIASADPEHVSGVIDLVRGAKGSVLAVVPHKRTLEEVFVDVVMKAGGE